MSCHYAAGRAEDGAAAITPEQIIGGGAILGPMSGRGSGGARHLPTLLRFYQDRLGCSDGSRRR